MVVCATFVAQILAGCATFTEYGEIEKTARQYYRRADYDRAVFTCAEALRLNPEYGKAQKLIKDAFRAAVKWHQAKIKELKASSAKFRWDDIVAEYEALTKLNRTVETLPTLKVKTTGEVIRFEIRDYSQNLMEAKTNAAEIHYQEGLVLLQKEGIDFQKQAAKEFKAALCFVPGYKDASERYEKCRREAIKRMAIIIIPFEDKSGKEGKYGAISEMITDEIIASVVEDSAAAEFSELVSREELEGVLREHELQISGLVDEQTAVEVGKLLGVHEILLGRITQIAYTAPITTIKRFERKTEIVAAESKEATVYETVSAKVKVYTRTSKASILGSYKIMEIKTGNLKKSAFFEGIADYQYQWATYDGDDRALKSEDNELVKKGRQLPPSEEELIRQAARNLSISITRDLKVYLR